MPENRKTSGFLFWLIFIFTLEFSQTKCYTLYMKQGIKEIKKSKEEKFSKKFLENLEDLGLRKESFVDREQGK